jgi:hypothetical protein
MKIVQCETCDYFFLPRGEMVPEWCQCGLCCTWWRIAQHGLISVWHAKGPNCCSVVGISNRFWKVMIPDSGVLAESDVFTEMNHVAVRVRPGFGSDTSFEEPVFLDGWAEWKLRKMEQVKKMEEPFVPKSATNRSLGSLLWRRPR